jgi:hypothetical protein
MLAFQSYAAVKTLSAGARFAPSEEYAVSCANVSGVRAQPSASKAQVRAEGASKVYTRDGQEGRKLRFHFCPECGTTVYWDLDLRPDHIVVAFGTFADAYPGRSKI